MNRGDLWCLAESDAEADRLLTAPRRRLALAGAGLLLAATLLGACSNGAAEKAQAGFSREPFFGERPRIGENLEPRLLCML